MQTNLYLLSLLHSLPLLPAFVEAKEGRGTVHPLDQPWTSSKRRDRIVSGMEVWLLLLIDLGEHGVDNWQELHDALIQMQILQTWEKLQSLFHHKGNFDIFLFAFYAQHAAHELRGIISGSHENFLMTTLSW